jgi:putative transposase
VHKTANVLEKLPEALQPKVKEALYAVFAAVRLRTTKTKHCGSRTTTSAMAFKLMATAQKKWLRL